MLKKLFNKMSIVDLNISERIKVYEASFKLSVVPPYEYFLNIINSISERDKISIDIQDTTENILNIIASDEKKYNEFMQQLIDDEEIYVKVKIDKEVKDNHFSVYSYDSFAEDLLDLSINEAMLAFSELMKDVTDKLVIEMFSDTKNFNTKTIFFTTMENVLIDTEVRRENRINNCRETSYFYNFDIYELIPDDFKIMCNYEDNPLTDLFDKITSLLSICFISSSCSIKDDKLVGIINGQRAKEYVYEISGIHENKYLYNVYNWIYTEGCCLDKALIARNVISLYCKELTLFEIDEKVMGSIQSNYNLYLKDNVKDYLELKNKVAGFINDTILRTGEYATALLDKFKTNFLALFGFLFTVMLSNIVSNKPLDNIFTKDITVLSEVVLIGSIAYSIICFLQARYEVKKAYDSYKILKENYKDIFDETDLLELFGNDKKINDLKHSIKITHIIYTIIWLIFLVALFIVVEKLSVSPTIKTVLDFLNK